MLDASQAARLKHLSQGVPLRALRQRLSAGLARRLGHVGTAAALHARAGAGSPQGGAAPASASEVEPGWKARARVVMETTADNPTGLDLTWFGTSSGSPTLTRNVSCCVVRTAHAGYVVDCGEGSQRQLTRTSIKANRINRIFITHMHGDHCFGLNGMLLTIAAAKKTAGDEGPIYVSGGVSMSCLAARHCIENTLGHSRVSSRSALGFLAADRQCRTTGLRSTGPPGVCPHGARSGGHGPAGPHDCHRAGQGPCGRPARANLDRPGGPPHVCLPRSGPGA